MNKLTVFLLSAFCAGWGCPTFAQCDLELSAAASNATPAIFTQVDYVFTLKNKGPEAATGIRVAVPYYRGLTAESGLVYTSNRATKGAWDPITQAWLVSTLGKDETAVLTLTLFTMKQTLSPFFGQVLAAAPNDTDSQPGNNSGQTPREDDEALIPGNAKTCDLKLEFLDTMCLPLPNPYFEVNYGYKVRAVTKDTAIRFVKISTDPPFTYNWVTTPGTASTAFNLYSFAPVVYYAHPIGNPTCVVTDTIFPPPGCGTPPQPSACLTDYFNLGNVYCLNNGAHYGLVIDLHYAGQQGNYGLDPSSGFTVFLNGRYAATGLTSRPLLLGLDNTLAMVDTNVHFRVVRNSDQQCIGQGFFNPSTYCYKPGFRDCNQSALLPWEEWIKRVALGGIDKTSGKATYNDFRASAYAPNNPSAFVNAGETVPFTVEVGFSWMTYREYFQVYLDTNRDGIFDNQERLWEGTLTPPPPGPNATATLQALLNIPANASTGLTTLKIAMQRGAYPSVCDPVVYGEVEYYSVQVLGGTPATNPCDALKLTVYGTECDNAGTPDHPEDDRYYIHYKTELPGAAGLSIYSLAFMGTLNDPLSRPPTVPGFKQYGVLGADTVYGPISIRDYPTLNFSSGAYLPNGVFCRSENAVVFAPPSCSGGQTPAPQPNCAASSAYPWEDWIAGVKIGAFEKNSGKSPYSDFASDPISLTLGHTPIRLTAGYSWYTYDEYWRVWIDFNHNGVLETPAEVAFEGKTTRPADGIPAQTLGGQLFVPATALSGQALARVVMRRYFNGSPCGQIQFGEVEDYRVNIAANRAPGSGREIAQTALNPATEDIALFPNPTSERVLLSLGKWVDRPVRIDLYNTLGISVLQQRFGPGAGPLEEVALSGIAPGQYFLKVETPGEAVVFKKLVVRMGMNY